MFKVLRRWPPKDRRRNCNRKLRFGTKALNEFSPDRVIEIVKDSGLRGRGGAGFPTGLKWSFARKAEGNEKYMVCNADEGDPGAFMDRALLEGTPHQIIEGMIIASYAIGANLRFHIRQSGNIP